MTNDLATKSIARAALGALAAAALSCGAAGPRTGNVAAAAAAPAELVLRGGRILTMDDERPEVEALAVRDGRVVAVGTSADVAPLIGASTRVVELAGRMATPGLVDGHAHLYGLGSALENVSVRDAKSAAEAAERVARAAAELAPGEWVTGRGWDQNLWTPSAFPSRQILDQAVPDRPVALWRVDGHAVWVSSRVLERAGIDRQTPDPPGGRIVRDAGGEPTGVLVDSAMDLVAAQMPTATAEARRRRILRAAEVAVSSGLTAVHEMGIDDATAAVYRELAGRGELPLRVYAYLGGDETIMTELGKRRPEPDDGSSTFAMRGVKLFADGALGSRGAALLAPYSDDPGNRGLLVTAPEALARYAAVAADAGWQLAIHAIGDAGNRAVLDAYEAALRAHPGADLRFRVEHAQVVAHTDLPRFGALGVLASMQPTHATSDMPWAEARVGAERIRGAYAWRTLLDSKARIVAGSDFPVEEVSPLLGLHAAVTRQDTQGRPPGGWHAGQVMTLAEALRAFTVEPAYAAFVEQHRGRLRPGLVADITVYDRELTAATLLDARIDMTVVGGRVVYERN